MSLPEIAALVTAFAALITALARDCERRVRQLEQEVKDAQARVDRITGNLSSLEKALQEQSGSYRPPPIR